MSFEGGRYVSGSSRICFVGMMSICLWPLKNVLSFCGLGLRPGW